MNVVKAINDPNLFRAYVAGEPDGDLTSWCNWLAFLRTLYGLKPLKKDHDVIRQATGRDPAKLSREGFDECLVLAGRRSGKSKMIEWIVRELVRNRSGFCLIDPHGSLYNDVLTWLAYLQPDREIYLFDPSSTDRIVGFNPFTRTIGDVGTRVNRLIRATIKAWHAENTDQTPRLERWLRIFYHYAP